MATWKDSTIKIYGNPSLADRLSVFQKKSDQQSSPGSGPSSTSSKSLEDPNYGRPVAGSKTDKRGRAAAAHVGREVIELCHLIREYGSAQEDLTVQITFKELFDMYQVISNKVVGVLLRARKHGLVQFPGEMLFQRRDDAVVITLVVDPDQIRNSDEATACVQTA